MSRVLFIFESQTLCVLTCIVNKHVIQGLFLSVFFVWLCFDNFLSTVVTRLTQTKVVDKTAKVMLPNYKSISFVKWSGYSISSHPLVN